MRTTRTEFISCPSCGRTLFDLEETTARIKSRTSHLKGLKIAVMGCVVNGPGEMADADFGYVGWGEDKIALFVGKEMVIREGDKRILLLEGEPIGAVLRVPAAGRAPGPICTLAGARRGTRQARLQEDRRDHRKDRPTAS